MSSSLMLGDSYVSDLIGSMEPKAKFIAEYGSERQKMAALKALESALAKLDRIQSGIKE